MNWTLVETHLSIVEKVIGLLSPRDPEEAFSVGQQALVRAAMGYDVSKGEFESLAFVAVKRALIDLRRRDKRGIYDPGEGRCVQADQQKTAEHNEAIRAVHHGLASLSPAKRRLMILRHGIGSEGHTIEQLGDLFNRNRSVVLSWLRSSEAALAPQLQGLLDVPSRPQ